MRVPRGYQRAKAAYDAHKAPSDYYEMKMVNKRWIYLATTGLFFSWIGDGCPTKEKQTNLT